jgi:serine/threonine protein kinase
VTTDRATPEPSPAKPAERRDVPELHPELEPVRAAPKQRAPSRPEFEPVRDNPDDSSSPESASESAFAPGSPAGRSRNVRAPGWDVTAVRPAHEVPPMKRDTPANPKPQASRDAPALEPVKTAKLDRATAAVPAQKPPEEDTRPPADKGERSRITSRRVERVEFRAVDEAAKELARAALQAEIEREEKLALQGFQAEDGEVPPSPEVAKRFDVILQLGRGGMSVVYLCRDPRQGGKVVAVKDIRAELKPGMKVEQRVEHEARLLKELSHPNIVKVYDFLKFNRGSAIVMEYVDGMPLDHEIGAGRRMSWDFGVRVMRQIGLALEYAHDKGVIHRDLKPDNILFSERHGVMKLVDFGLARIFGDGPDMHMTRTGMVVGTPHYMSPEQVSGKALDQRSDVYSFGATIYYLLTGQRHVEGTNIMDILEQQRSRNIVPPGHVRRDVPAWLSYIVGKMMEIRPEDRYPDIRAVLDDLDRAEADPESFTRAQPRGPVKRFAGKPLVLNEFSSMDVPAEPAQLKPESNPSTPLPLEPPPGRNAEQISALLVEISTRLERAEKRSLTPVHLILLVGLTALIVALAVAAGLLLALRLEWL